MNRLLVILSVCMPPAIAGCTTQDRQGIPSRQSGTAERRDDKPVKAETRTVLKEGAIEISRGETMLHGPREAKLVKVWEYNRDTTESQWLQEHYGKKRVVYLQIADTPYSLLVIDGSVTPLVSVAGPWELWRIDGLKNFCQAADVVRVDEKKVMLIAGGADMRNIVTLDFTRGLTIGYTEDYHGP